MSLKSTLWKPGKDYKKKEEWNRNSIYNVIAMADDGAALKSCIKSVILRKLIKSSLCLFPEYFIKTLCWLKIGTDLYLFKLRDQKGKKKL